MGSLAGDQRGEEGETRVFLLCSSLALMAALLAVASPWPQEASSKEIASVLWTQHTHLMFG
jgi:hypothetical protein